MTTITEIIPKDMPDWFKQDMEDGQVFCRLVKRMEDKDKFIDELQTHIEKMVEYFKCSGSSKWWSEQIERLIRETPKHYFPDPPKDKKVN